MRPGSARGPAGVEDAGSWLFSLPWLGAAGLLQNERAIDFVGNSDAAGLGEGFRIFFRQHRTPHPGAGRVAERPSPLMPLVICENIEFRNTASKSCDDAFALVCACGDTFVRASAS